MTDASWFCSQVKAAGQTSASDENSELSSVEKTEAFLGTSFDPPAADTGVVT